MVQEWAVPLKFYRIRTKFLGNLSNMFVSTVVGTLIKRRDIYKRMITSTLNSINARKNLVTNSLLAQKELVMNWLSSVSHMNEDVLNAFIENEMDAEIINKESEQEVLFNLFTLNELAVCEKFINSGDGCGVELPGKVKQPYIQYKMAPKLKCPVFDPRCPNCDRLAYKYF